MTSTTSTIAVLGAGLQGCCIAFELARRGHKVTLVEQDPLAVNRASLRNEGKIHLGLIYAQDKTGATADLQLRGALSFAPLLTRWLGEDAGALGVSTPFTYLVAEDSLLGLDELEAHYTRLEDRYTELMADDPSLHYLGGKPERLTRRTSLDALKRHFNVARLIGGFETAELAIDTDRLAAVVRDGVAVQDNIDFTPNVRVESVMRTPQGFRIEAAGASGRETIEADQVVNATWENRFAIDKTIGLEHADGWLHRLKYRIIARPPAHLRKAPSATMVLGRYGDVVMRPDGTAYLSWYPLGLRGWTHDLAPPEAWTRPCRGDATLTEEADFVKDVLAEIDDWYPDVCGSEPILVDAGAIVAYGRSDVDKSSSGLHDRTHIGVTSLDGYHSVDPGKLTTAPHFAMIAADRICDRSVDAEVERSHALENADD